MAGKSKSRGIVYDKDGLFRRAGCICLDATGSRVSCVEPRGESLVPPSVASAPAEIQPAASDFSKARQAAPCRCGVVHAGATRACLQLSQLTAVALACHALVPTAGAAD